MARTETLVQTLHLRAKAAGIYITTAESCTGGMLGELITSQPGASLIYDRGFITYSDIAKEKMLGVQAHVLRNHGAVSVAVAAQMAAGALSRAQAQIAVSITGVAGPGSEGGKPEGRVCFGLAQHGERVLAEEFDFGARGRTKIREMSCEQALHMLINAMPR